MKRLVTKSLGSLLLLTLFAVAASAQPMLYGFNCVADDTTHFTVVYTGDAGNGNSPKPYMNFSDYTADPVEGPCALGVDWKMYTNQSWGGFMQLVHNLPAEQGHYDLSDYTHLRIWYRNLQPTSSTQVETRLNLLDASGGQRTVDEGTEVWYSQTANILTTPASEGWVYYDMPLVDNGGGAPINDGGYSLPGWAGGTHNDVLDLDMIAGYVIEWTATALPGDSTATGNIVFDKLTPVGVRYDMFENFDQNRWTEPGAWWGTGSSNPGFAILTGDEAMEGEGTLVNDWTVHASEGWGGGLNYSFNLPEGEHYADMSSRSHLSLFFNNVEKASVAGMNFRIVLREVTEDGTEPWVYQNSEILYEEEGWQRLLIPLLKANEMGPEGFVNPPADWGIGNAIDGNLDPSKIAGYTIEFSAPGELSGQTITGEIHFDRMTSYGYRETDVTAPNAVTGLDVTPGQFANIVTWEDVPDEANATYAIFYSTSPITDVTAPGVEVVARGVGTGTQVYTHPLLAPKTNQDVTYYYAITATDRAGNVSDVTSTASATTNTAQGIVTIAMEPPANFVADGDVSEWSGITPIRLAPSVGSKVITNFNVADDQDLSVDVYLALDEEAIYIAYDVTDNLVELTGAANAWENDGTELYIGLYDWRGDKHAGYQTEAQPDYKFVFYGDQVRLDLSGGAQIYTTSHANYAVAEKFPSGYVIEAKLPYDTFAFETAPAFVPQNGMRIPLDIVIQDQDEGTRQGIMVYSRDNNDNSWQSPRNWGYTWIGDAFTTPNEDGGTLPQTFTLDQNYPNPFSTGTTIAYALPRAEQVKITIYNTLGQAVRVVDLGQQAAGEYQVRFDADGLASGVYVYQIQAGQQVASKKMMLVR